MKGAEAARSWKGAPLRHALLGGGRAWKGHQEHEELPKPLTHRRGQSDGSVTGCWDHNTQSRLVTMKCVTGSVHGWESS